MRDLALNPVTQDLDVSTGTLKLTSGSTRVRQRLFLRLGLIQGTWALNLNAGIPLFTRILGKGTQAVADSIYREAIASCPGVATVTKLSITANVQRSLTVDFQARTVEGEIVGPFPVFEAA